MKISVLASQYMAVLPIGCVLDDEQVLRSLRDATRQYCGCAALASGEKVDANALADGEGQDVDLSHGELSLIRPLWMLYLERENSMALEASRTQGAELYGRSVAETQVSIEMYEQRLPALAFTSDFVTV